MPRTLAAAVAWALLLLAACTERDQDDKGAQIPARERSITIGIAQEPDTLWIPFKEMLAAEEVVRPSCTTLTILDEDWELIPWTAERIPTRENGDLVLFEEGGVQKMRTTWRVREGFFWPDGEPLTAADYAFTYRLYNDPELEIIDRTVVEKIEKMEVLGDDERTLVVTWKEVFAGYADFRNHEVVPEHLVRPIYEAKKGDLKRDPFGTRPALAGAFTIQEWVPGSHIIAVKNPHAKGFLEPRLDRIIWRIIPKTNTLAANLLSDNIDAISPIGMTFDQGLEIEKQHGEKVDVHFTEGLVWEHIDFHLGNPILKDKRVRQALAHGANRELISRELFEGKQPVAHGTQSPRSRFHNPDVKKYPYDPKKAAALLDEAGWEMTERGVREKDGQPLRLTLMTTSGNKTREQVEVFLQSQWKEIGVDLELKNQPAKVFFGETLRRRAYDGMAMYAWTMDPTNVLDTLWRCDYIPSEENNWQGQNQPGWCHDEADRLLKEMFKTLDPDKRAALGRRFEAIWAEELPALPLYFRVDVSVTKKGLLNWKPTGTIQPVTWNAHRWEWADQDQAP